MGAGKGAQLVPAEELLIVNLVILCSNVLGKAQVHARGKPCLNGDDAC